nr:uncharacterized protein LOC110351363 isoform X3 [Anas platyrhynchos]
MRLGSSFSSTVCTKGRAFSRSSGRLPPAAPVTNVQTGQSFLLYLVNPFSSEARKNTLPFVYLTDANATPLLRELRISLGWTEIIKKGTCVSVPPTTTGKGDERAPTCLSIAVLCRGKQDQAPEYPRNKTSRNAKSSITRRPAPSLGGSTDMEKIPINPPGRSQGVMAFGVGDRGCD